MADTTTLHRDTPATGAAPTIDPVTFEVLKHRLWQITDEQAVTIKTISASPIVVEGNDFNVGIFTDDGRVIAAGIGSLVHVTTMGSTIENILRTAGSIRPGDVFMTNDPFLGALHQNDVVVAAPLFAEGDVVLWVANVLHHPDVGGIDEGSFCINARNLYQDPPRYFLKIVDRGEFSVEVERTFVTNSRLPDAVALDLRAQIGAANVAERRMREVIDAYGLPTVLAAAEHTLAVAEEALRERLRTIPDGSWEADVWMDGDRVGSDAILRVHVRLDKRDDHLLFDYTGSDRQVDAAVNSTFHATYAGSVVPVYTFICAGDIDWNDAVKRCVEVVAPPGTVVNATFPAPVSICTVGFRWLVTTAAQRVVADMLATSGTMRENACPSWTPGANCNNVFGITHAGVRVGALLSDHRAGGAGARSFGDGFSHAGQVTGFSSAVANVESIEWKLPLLYLYRRQLADSGGPGRYRGGLTAESALVPFGTDQLILKSTNCAGTDMSNASGIDGGYPGAGSQVMIAHGVDVMAELAAGRSPIDALDRAPKEFLPSKAEALLAPDDVMIYYPPAGGGYGDPLDRDLDAIVQDLALGRISPAGAEHFYGVAFDPSGAISPTRTAARRTSLRHSRLSSAPAPQPSTPASDPPSATPGAIVSPPPPHEHVGPQFADAITLVATNGTQSLRCRCGFHFGPTLEATARRRHQALSAAGPWLAKPWNGQSPNFHLEELICPACAQLHDVRERRTT